MFLKLEFKSLLARIPRFNEDGTAPVIANEEAAPENAFAAKIVRIDSIDALNNALEAARKVGTLALIPDADNPAPMRANLSGLGFAADAETGYYVPLKMETPTQETGEDADGFGGLFGGGSENAETTFAATLTDFKAILEDARIAKIGHNVKIAEILLERAGFKPTPFQFDAQIAAYLLDANRSAYPLSDLAEQNLDLRLDAEDAFSPKRWRSRPRWFTPLWNRCDETGGKPFD